MIEGLGVDARPDPVYDFAQGLIVAGGGPPSLIASVAFVLGVEFALQAPDTAERLVADERDYRHVAQADVRAKLRALARIIDAELDEWAARRAAAEAG